MCHECPECGQMCYCDQDDTFMESGADECEHECNPDHDDDDGWGTEGDWGLEDDASRTAEGK